MRPTIANVDMAAAWDGDEGEDWARGWERYDRSIRAYHHRLMAAASVSPGEQVLDVGCGNGQSTRDAARAAHGGWALGVDLSSRMLERARERARAEGLTNVRFEQADAQVHPFDPAAYDVVLSRFGAMFFADPLAAFSNMAGAMRPGGRLVIVAWQALDHNEWLQAIRAALAAGRTLPVPPVGAPGPSGLADPDRVSVMLEAAGLGDVRIQSLHEMFWAGADADDAFEFVSATGVARGLVRDLDGAHRARALAALRATMAAHDTPEGVVFASAAWLITARRARLDAG